MIDGRATEEAVGAAQASPAGVDGERGAAWVQRGTSIQAKVQNALALGLLALLGGAFLLWYYTRVAAVPPPVEQGKAKAAVQAEMSLPPLGPAPVRAGTSPDAVVDAASVGDTTPPRADVFGNAEEARAFPALAAAPVEPAPEFVAPPVAAVDPVLQRRLEAPVLIRGAAAGAGATVADPEFGADGPLDLDGPAIGAGRPGMGLAGGSAADDGSALAGRLRPTRTVAVAAGVAPDRRFLLPKGAFIDCTLETAIDSSLPGMTTCITATDVWSADGSVVLLERGTKLVGETRGEVQAGHERLFVLWSEARTPNGVVVELASPGTDALGRSGVGGRVDTHFGARFGAAILISLIDAGTAALVAAQSDGDGSVVIAPQGARDVTAELLRQSVGIAPTLRVAQGGRMQVLVARDVSFEQVYALGRR